MSYSLILPYFPQEIRTLLLDPTISDLMINGTSGVYADRAGVVEHVKLAEVYTNERLTAAIERVARVLGQDLTMQNPILNTRMPDGSRVAVVGPPASIGGPTLTIRKFNKWYTSDELVESGSLPIEVRNLIVSLIGERKNGIIAGGTGSGKTTLMKALLDHVPMTERLCVIEQPAELQILQPNTIRWEAVDAIPGQVAITPSELLAAALRHRPDRIVMGEIRNEAGYDLLQAMNTGHGGTLSTIHASSAVDALNRLANLALSARPNLNHPFMRSETAKAIHYALYCERAADGRRQVREVIEVQGYDFRTEQFQIAVVYSATQPKAVRELSVVGTATETPQSAFRITEEEKGTIMPLFTVKTSRKVETSMKLEESTAKMLDRYAHFHKGSADDVVNEALEYIFQHDKDFQQHLKQNPDEEVASSVRIKKVPGSVRTAKSSANGNGSSNGTAAQSASSASTNSAR